MKIDAERLLSRLEELGTVGAAPEGGVRRLAGTQADGAGRDMVAGWLRDAGLDVKVDRIGNLFGIRPGAEDTEPVMSGSHLDSVDYGGTLDGAYGVLAALETIETLNDLGRTTRRPLAVAAFTNEEGARFQPDMMGSLVHAGGLGVEEALATEDQDGVTLRQALNDIGYAGDLPCGTIGPSAFVELHIEQGPVLEREAIAIGAVEDLQGISWTEVVFKGEANHAGTTPMALRHDAGYCAGELTAVVRRIATEAGPGQVATVGTIELSPGIINVVPGGARLTVDLRNADNAVLREAEKTLEQTCARLADAEGVEVSTRRLARFDPVTFDAGIVETIENHAGVLGVSCRRMTSGAGHDAQMMARVCPTAMIFVPSVGGISHNPAEHTDPDDLVAGANVLLNTLVELAER